MNLNANSAWTLPACKSKGNGENLLCWILAKVTLQIQNRRSHCTLLGSWLILLCVFCDCFPSFVQRPGVDSWSASIPSCWPPWSKFPGREFEGSVPARKTKQTIKCFALGCQIKVHITKWLNSPICLNNVIYLWEGGILINHPESPRKQVVKELHQIHEPRHAL